MHPASGLIGLALLFIAAAGAQDAGSSRTTEPDFVSLSDDPQMAAWSGDRAGYQWTDGVIVATPEGGNLLTVADHANFILRFEFKLSPKANNGIGIRTMPGENPAYSGMEIQVLDVGYAATAHLKPWQHHGSIYGVVPAKRGALAPGGEWNEQEILADGSHIRVTLNGTVIVDADLSTLARHGTPDGTKHPGLRRSAGRIALCGHGDLVEFRNMRIRDLP